jgi:hydroxyquinol 1,2-dioxygenase
MRTDAGGYFKFRTVKPAAYPIPGDGPVGQMLEAVGRHPWRPAHIHFMVHADGYQSLVTQCFDRGDRYLESDAVFGVRASLMGEFVMHSGEGRGPGAAPGQPFYSLDFDLVLNPQPE